MPSRIAPSQLRTARVPTTAVDAWRVLVRDSATFSDSTRMGAMIETMTKITPSVSVSGTNATGLPLPSTLVAHGVIVPMTVTAAPRTAVRRGGEKIRGRPRGLGSGSQRMLAAMSQPRSAGDHARGMIRDGSRQTLGPASHAGDLV